MGFFMKGSNDLFGLLEFLADAKMRARGKKERDKRELQGKNNFSQQIEG
jgi:hypothetical protein